MFTHVRKRDGRVVPFDQNKITQAVFKAALACGGSDFKKAQSLCDEVVALVTRTVKDGIPEIEVIQDTVEKVLIENGHAQTAKAYILYREKRSSARSLNALIGGTIDMFSSYLKDTDWKVKENANQQKSINGLNNYVRESFTRNYWLHEIYPREVREAHENGSMHIHDLGFFGPYCAGWDLRQLLTDGFGGVAGKVESKPAAHLRSFLGQIINSTFTTQGECAGAQAWSSIDTYCAPFIRKDGLGFKEVKQCLQEFLFNLNVPTRVGFQCPFSNLTFDLTVPNALKDQPVIMAGEQHENVYADYQKEMDLFNLAFCEAMEEGDAKGRVFTFPIPTINITDKFNWESPSAEAFMRITAKYGIPYFANYVNSDLSPDDAVSMCCRLRLDTSELRKRGGGLFGSNPLTGSIGVVTLNLSRIGYKSVSKEDYFSRLKKVMKTAVSSLEIKRKMVETQTEAGLYPYSRNYLKTIKQKTGAYWFNHFSTIGLLGMNESVRNFLGVNIAEPAGRKLALELMHFLRAELKNIQQETGHVYNLEATPAEGAAHRLARLDKDRYPDIFTAGTDVPYYTNSTQLPVDFTDDIFRTLELQDELQSLYTGGTVLHLYLGEAVENPKLCRQLIQRVFSGFKLPYFSITPTFSICPSHGYISGEYYQCPQCSVDTEVYSRVTGYLRPVQNFNVGKQAEYQDRLKYELPQGIQ